MPLKVYTRFRLNPQIFPEIVSTSVASSEATTLFRAQETAATLAVDGVASDDGAIGSAGTLAAPSNPIPTTEMPPKRARLPSGNGVNVPLDAPLGDSFSRSLTVPPSPKNAKTFVEPVL